MDTQVPNINNKGNIDKLQSAASELVINSWALTIVSFLSLSKIVTKGNLMKSAIVKSNIPHLVGIVIGDQKILVVNPHYWGKKL